MKGKQEEIDKIKKQLTDSPDVALPSQDQFILNLSKVNQSLFEDSRLLVIPEFCLRNETSIITDGYALW